jgi:sensor histidine kinase YesM
MNRNYSIPPKYIYLLVLGILIISVFLITYGYGSLKYKSVALSFGSTLITTFVIWVGSMSIAKYFTSKYDIFKESFKLLALMGTSLVIFSSSVIIGELFVVQKFLVAPINKFLLGSSIIITILTTLFITTIHASYYFFTQWKENRLKAEKLERAGLEARYGMLREQLNPHFLFNSLNTLLSMVENDPNATQYVESLSDILRYGLQNRDKEAVLLRDEIAIARHYLYIQQRRFGDKLHVTMDVPESSYHFAIPPMSLQMLLENAIKHNVVSKEKNLHIDIHLTPDHYLVVQNNIQPKTDVEASTGIGLANIDSRYRILSDKEIKVNTENEIFKVMLPLLDVSL